MLPEGNAAQHHKGGTQIADQPDSSPAAHMEKHGAYAPFQIILVSASVKFRFPMSGKIFRRKKIVCNQFFSPVLLQFFV